MPGKFDKVALGDKFLKRNVKMIECQRQMVHWWHQAGMSIHSISKLFRVNKRLIQFILFPERAERNRELRKARGGSKIYYNKDKHNAAIKDHRNYKKKTLS